MEKLSTDLVMKEMQERFREAACNGDEYTVHKMIQENPNLDVDNKHTINGWTALHWAAKRGHNSVVSTLLKNGANKNLETKKGETALQLALDTKVCKLLGGVPSSSLQEELAIVPNYLANPPFPYVGQDKEEQSKSFYQNITDSYYPYPPKRISDSLARNSSVNADVDENELVLKARIANLIDKDFIEIELPRDQLKFDLLFNLMCEELQVTKDLVKKVRKLPDTIIRKDKDVKRLKNFQELELVLTSKAMSEGSLGYSTPAPNMLMLSIR